MLYNACIDKSYYYYYYYYYYHHQNYCNTSTQRNV
jgi:hypothetical protein